IFSAPDASIGDVGGDFVICSNAQQTATLDIFNASLTFPINTQYIIEWGDGTADTLDNSTFDPATPVSHTYSTFGFYDIIVSVTADGSTTCNTSSRTYTFYYGSNPAVGFNSNGNTVGLCAPATIDFPITNTDNNSDGTLYEVFANGELIDTYNHPPPPNFTFTFQETSCDLVTTNGLFTSAYDVRIRATNPCASTSLTVEPIELSSPPIPMIDIAEFDQLCPGDPVQITNSTENIAEVEAGVCSASGLTQWSLAPNDGWQVVGGSLFNSDVIEVVFDSAGVYSITLTFTSAACGVSTVTETFTINEPAVLDSVTINPLTANVPGAGPCVPAEIELMAGASGLNVGYEWTISGDPNGYVFTAGTDSTDQNAQVEFIEPGSYNVSLSAFNLCDTIVYDTTLVFNGPPDALLAPIGPFCETAVLDFDALNTFYTNNGNNIDTYSWSFPGGTPATSADIFPSGIVYSNSGTYTVSVTVSNACGVSTHSVDFEIQQPQPILLDGDFETCVNGDSILLIASPVNGTWSGNGVEVNTGIFFPSQAGLGTSELIYSFGIGACNTQDTLEITVVDQPSLNLPFPELCIDDLPVDLNAASSNAGSWSTMSNGLSGSMFDPSLAGLGFHDFIFQDSTSTCTNTATIEVLPLPAVSAPADTSFCNIDFLIFLPEGTPAGGDYAGPGVNNNGNRFNPVTAGGIGNYIITYVYTDPVTGCTGAAPMNITVTALENADAGPDETVCFLDAPFQPTGNNVMMGEWSGPGIVDSTGLFDPQLSGVGIHQITLTLDEGLCQTSDTKIIEVLPAPTVDLALPPVCVDATVLNLNDGVIEPGTWTDPAGNILDSLFNPTTVGIGTYPLIFTAQSTGCSDRDTLEIVPLPTIIVNDTAVCNSIDVVNLPTASPSNGSWTGAAIMGNTFDPQDAGGVGIYNATYTVVDSNGCVNTADILIDVFQPDYIEAGIDELICVDQGPTPLSGFDPVSGGVWSGNGIVNPSGVFDPTFTGPGIFELTFTLDTLGCLLQDTKLIEVVEVQIEGGPDQTFCEGLAPFILSGFSPNGGIWTGPGIQSPGSYVYDPDLAGVGAHELTYTYTDPTSGCIATATRMITIDPQPVPGFDGPEESCVGVNNLFLNTSSNYDSSFWTFGNGNTSTLDVPINAYFIPGTYEVSLTVANGFGCVDSIKQDIFITEPPNAFFEPDTTEGCSNVPVLIQNFSDGYEPSYFWDFGNGQTDTVYQPNLITYPPGTKDTTYVITLEVSNVCGTVTHTDSILVQPIPTAEFSPDVDDGCTPLEVSFVNQSIGNPEDFFWDLGNGMVWNDSVPPPTTYLADSVDTEYIVTLVSSNECGNDTAFHVITVFPPNVDVFTFADTTAGCEPLTVNFTSFSTQGAVISWDFGDGGTSDETNPTYTFDEAGVYDVIQFASNGCGYDSTILAITVLPEPQVQFTQPPFVCLG
ncbi:MAG: PKD domain-containing protein, partial [Bacteroidota bacterium]